MQPSEAFKKVTTPRELSIAAENSIYLCLYIGRPKLTNSETQRQSMKSERMRHCRLR